MSEDKKGFLFNVVSNIGDGHQIQAAFNLEVGATKADMNAVLDEYFSAITRQAARIRVPAAEAEVARQRALVDGIEHDVKRLREAPTINGKRRLQDEAQYNQVQTQLNADKAKLEIMEKNLNLTYKEAEVEGSCLQRVS